MTQAAVPTLYFEKARLQMLIDRLRAEGYTVVGPQVAQQAIVYDELTSADQLPRGWTDVQAPGQYRLERRGDDLFGYVVGPQAWKQFLFPPVINLGSAERAGRGWTFRTADQPQPRFALLGVRACELAAIAVQDRTFLGSGYQDPIYKARREAAFIIAVNCTQAASTCFCTSMGTGPRCRSGFDLALTELADGFLCEVAGQRAAVMIEACQPRSATGDELSAAESRRRQAEEQITRRLDTHELPQLLKANLEHPRWQQVGERCLSCTNCTMVCPTCFCCSVAEVPDLAAERIDRQRRWDSCFHPDFSYMNGGIVRHDIPSRYRQWLTHKLSTWHDQFDTSGCVGCGRCITWCPVGIDLTEEVAALRENAS